MENKWKNLAFWSWNDDIEKEETLYQLMDLKDKGYGGVVIHARAGLKIEYMGEQWFEIFDACVLWASENCFEIWIYDEYGWPSGFGGGIVNGLGREYQLKSIVAYQHRITKSTHEFLCKNENNGNILYVYSVTDKNYVDLLNPQVAKKFIECTHDVYYNRYRKYFGSVIKGVFTDEPQVCVRPYSPYLENAFYDKYGISFKENAWRLFVENPEQDDFFYRYYSIISTLFRKNYTEIVAKWCEDKGIALTGHFAGEDGLIGQYVASGGVMANYPIIQQPGIDFLGRRLSPVVLTKQISSIKNQFEKDIVLSETMGCCGWNISFAQMAWIWGYQASFGINRACLHLSAYSIRGIRKRDYPAFFSYQEPWWECFSAISQEMSLINEFVSQGKETNDILVLNPITSVYQNYDSMQRRVISAEYRETLENLIKKQYGFDLGDEHILAVYGKVSKNKLTVGKSEYSFVIVPQSVTWERSTFELLQKFKACGGKILFVNEKPSMCERVPISNEFDNIMDSSIIPNRASFFEKYFRSVGYHRKAVVADNLDGNVCESIVLRVAEDENKKYVFIQNIDCCAEIDGVLKISDYGSLSESGRVINCFKGLNGIYAHIKVPKMGCLRFILNKNQKSSPEKENFVLQKVLVKKNPRLTECNAFTIDKAYYELTGFKSGLIDTALIQNQINNTVNSIENKQSEVKVVYTFRTKCFLEHLRIAVETKGVNCIYFNQVDITDRFNDWYLDKCIRLANIEDLQVVGENRISLICNVVGERSFEDVSKGYETQINKFSYKTEIESVYVLGDFFVENNGKLFDDQYLTVMCEDFVLNKPKNIDFSKELTEQGLFFYRGGVEYFCDIIKGKNEQVCIRFSNSRFITAKIICNGLEKVVINPFAETDITELLNAGRNSLKIIVYGSNRNLLGPFHHKSGEPKMVGGTAFYGIKGVESVVYDHLGEDLYDAYYHFVKFTLGDTIMLKYK